MKRSSLKPSSKNGVTEEQHITWELDGGNYSANDEAKLFRGRLYPDGRTLAFAKLRYHGREVASTLAVFIPFMTGLTGRS